MKVYRVYIRDKFGYVYDEAFFKDRYHASCWIKDREDFRNNADKESKFKFRCYIEEINVEE